MATDEKADGNPTPELAMGLSNLLGNYRAKRAEIFTPQQWIDEKCKLFNEYMANNGLSACLVSLSGGIDSAVTLGLMQRATTMENSPIRRVVGIMQPIHSSAWAQDRGTEIAGRLTALNELVGSTIPNFDGQDLESAQNALGEAEANKDDSETSVKRIASRTQKRDLIEKMRDPCNGDLRSLGYHPPPKKGVDVESFVIDQTTIYDTLKATIDGVLGTEGAQFAGGQLRSYMRTPSGYYVAQLISQGGNPCVVMGTGNKDEDGYLAYFCKAGDGVVDVQLIADLHKSQVYQVGRCLGLPASVLVAAPSADLWDGQTDEDELGFSYNFIELLMNVLADETEKVDAELAENAERMNERQALIEARIDGFPASQGWGPEETKQWNEWGTAARTTHNRNKHKIDSPVNI